MKKLWMFIGDKQFWRGLEKDKYFKIKPSWDEDWGAKLAGKIGIYDPFFGYRVDEQILFCSGIIMTEPYITPDGWTLELFPKNSFEKPIETKKLFASFNKPVPEDKRFCVFSLDESEVEALCSCLKDRKLQEEFESLSRLGKMELGWEMMKSLFAERGCSDRESEEAIKILYHLISSAARSSTKGKKEFEAEYSKNIQYLEFLLHAENEEPDVWARLWERLLQACRLYFPGLSQIKKGKYIPPQEIHPPL